MWFHPPLDSSSACPPLPPSSCTGGASALSRCHGRLTWCCRSLTSFSCSSKPFWLRSRARAENTSSSSLPPMSVAADRLQRRVTVVKDRRVCCCARICGSRLGCGGGGTAGRGLGKGITMRARAGVGRGRREIRAGSPSRSKTLFIALEVLKAWHWLRVR